MRTLVLLLICLYGAVSHAGEPSFDVRIEHRKVVAPGSVIKVTRGDKVSLHWTSDEAVELHMHGYDIHLSVSPGKTSTMNIDAGVSGRFPVTSHGFGGHHGHGHGHEALLYVEIHPE